MTAALRKDIVRLQKELKELKTQLVDAQQVLKRNEDALRQTEEGETQTLARDRAGPAESERQVEEQAWTDKGQQHIKSVQAQLSEQAATIDSLKEQLAAAKRVNKDQQAQVEMLQAAVEEQEATARSLKDQLATADEARRDLQTQTESLQLELQKQITINKELRKKQDAKEHIRSGEALTGKATKKSQAAGQLETSIEAQPQQDVASVASVESDASSAARTSLAGLPLIFVIFLFSLPLVACLAATLVVIWLLSNGV